MYQINATNAYNARVSRLICNQKLMKITLQPQFFIGVGCCCALLKNVLRESEACDGCEGFPDAFFNELE
jgi:hypothetical protein